MIMRDGESGTANSTFTRLLRSESSRKADVGGGGGGGGVVLN